MFHKKTTKLVIFNVPKCAFIGHPVSDLRGDARDAHPPPFQTLSISCIFGGKLADSYFGPPESWRPLLGEILDPPLTWQLFYPYP